MFGAIQNFASSWQVQINVQLKNQVFYPGNLIEGFVSISTSAPINFYAIRVKAVGKERCVVEQVIHHPRTDPNHPPPPPTKIYHRQTNVLFKQLVTLAGHLKCAPSFVSIMPPGTYTYPFAIQLPTNLVPSFQRRHGQSTSELIYHVKAYCDIPTGKDAVCYAPFTVIRAMPASQHAQAGAVSVDRQFDVTCCCCIDKGKVGARFFMDRTLIAIDRDNLLVCVDVDNTKGEEPVESIEFTLTNSYSWSAMGHSVGGSNCVGKQFLKQVVPPGQSARIQGVIPLPRDKTQPSVKTVSCSSRYTISLEVNIPWATDPCQSFDVIVAQSVDPTNFSPAINFTDANYTILSKGQLSGPETFYAPPPPPQMVYAYAPIPLPPPPSAPMFQYAAAPPPLGLPAVTWQTQAVPFQSATAQHNVPPPAPLGGSITWQGGYGQQQMPDTAPPAL